MISQSSLSKHFFCSQKSLLILESYITLQAPISTKWSNALKQVVGNLPRKCLSVFGHSVGLALKGINTRFFIKEKSKLKQRNLMNIIVKHGFKKDFILHFLICHNISYPFPSAKVRLKVIYTSKLFIFFYCLTFSVEELKLS